MAGEDGRVAIQGSAAAYLTWEDLTVVLPRYGSGPAATTLVKDITGYAMPGRLLAIMGPSGSGKSTLLDALAGRLSINVVMSGRVLLNGKGARLEYGEVVALVLSAGFVRLIPDLPKPIWRYPVSFLSYGSWALRGQYKNDMVGLEFKSMVAGVPQLHGEDVIKNTFGIRLDHSKWLDLSMIFVIIVISRVIFFVVLKIKERASPLMRSMYLRMADDFSLSVSEGVNREEKDGR